MFANARQTLKTIIKHLFTGKDNHTWDLGRILWFVGVMLFFAMTIYSIIDPGFAAIFNPIEWGTGFGSVLALGGVALKVKESSEPQPRDEYMWQYRNPPHQYNDNRWDLFSYDPDSQKHEDRYYNDYMRRGPPYDDYRN